MNESKSTAWGGNRRGEAVLKVNVAVYFGKLISWSLKQQQEFFLFKMADSESQFIYFILCLQLSCNRKDSPRNCPLWCHKAQLQSLLGSNVWSTSQHVKNPSATMWLRQLLLQHVFVLPMFPHRTTVFHETTLNWIAQIKNALRGALTWKYRVARLYVKAFFFGNAMSKHLSFSLFSATSYFFKNRLCLKSGF